MQSITTVTQKGQITLPVAIRNLLNIKSYDQVSVTLDKQRIIVMPVIDALDLAGSIPPNSKTTVLKARKLLEKSYRPV